MKQEVKMSRRGFVSRLFGAAAIPVLASATQSEAAGAPKIARIEKSDAEWKKILTPEQFSVLRNEGTERPFTSPLNNEKRKGTFHCSACDLPVYTSEMKFDSGTGWPSFFTTLPGAFETKTDYKFIYPRTEYHCAQCGGHHGHVFNDGPSPTGQRWCNNGVSLKFKPA